MTQLTIPTHTDMRINIVLNAMIYRSSHLIRMRYNQHTFLLGQIPYPYTAVSTTTSNNAPNSKYRQLVM